MLSYIPSQQCCLSVQLHLLHEALECCEDLSGCQSHPAYLCRLSLGLSCPSSTTCSPLSWSLLPGQDALQAPPSSRAFILPLISFLQLNAAWPEGLSASPA